MAALVLLTLARGALAQPFVDVSERLGPPRSQSGVVFALCLNVLDPRCLGYYTGGTAVGDYDADGDPDIFYTRFGLPNVLYENQGDGTFVDVAEEVGLGGVSYSNGAAFVDVDNDGDLDLVVTRALVGPHALFINDGFPAGDPARPHFEDQASARGFTLGSSPGNAVLGVSVAAGDYDRDGWPDFYVTDWSGAVASCGAEHSRLLRNRGAGAPGHFEDTTEVAGVTITNESSEQVWTFAAAFRDLDGDGFQDLAIAGDFGTSRLFWSSGDGTFVDGSRSSGVATDASGMGSTFADFDRDGDLDWFVSAVQAEGLAMSFLPEWDGNRLYRNEGGRQFTDVTDSAGVRNAGWPWGAAFFDADHDGDHDLVVTTGHVFIIGERLRSYYFEQSGPATFTELGASTGFEDDGDGRGLVVLDFDQDGDLDVFLVRSDATPLLLRNEGGASLGDWLRVRAVGSSGTRDAYGALVWIESSALDNSPRLESVDSATDYLGQSERVAHFGLGPGFAASGATLRVRVRFLGGHEVVVDDVAPNQELTVVEPSAASPLPPASPPADVCARPSGACAPDCDGNQRDDRCELVVDAHLDCDEDGVLDTCALALGLALDANGDGVVDGCPIPDAGVSLRDAGSTTPPSDAGPPAADATLDTDADADGGPRADASASGSTGGACHVATPRAPGSTGAALWLGLLMAVGAWRRVPRRRGRRHRLERCVTDET